MKSKLILIISLLIIIAFFGCAGVFFSHDTGKVEALFTDTIKALDSEQGLRTLFTSAAVERSEALDKKIDEINEFYKGKSIDVTDYAFYRQSATGYRMHATVRTDSGEYFVCILGSGARRVDSYGIDQLIIEDNQEFRHKKLFKKKEFDKYLEHAEKYGITIRVKGDI